VPTTENHGTNSSTVTWSDVGARGLFSASEQVVLYDTGLGAYVSKQLAVTNLSAVQPLTLDLFHMVDFDAGGDPAGDSVQLVEWTPVRLLRLTDDAGDLADHLATPAADAFLVRAFGAGDVGALLSDGDLDPFDDSGLPFGPGDATAGYRFPFVVPAAESRIALVVLSSNSPRHCDGFPNGLFCDGFERGASLPFWIVSTPP
jgi:hypothetical protein